MAEKYKPSTNDRFIARRSRLSGSRDVQLFERLHTDLCNLLLCMLPEVELQIKLIKARPSFYLINKTGESKVTFKFLDAYLMIRRVQPNPLIVSAHDKELNKGALARINITLAKLKTYISAGSKSRSIDYGELISLTKRLLFAMIQNADFNGSVETTPTNLGTMISAKFRSM